ncbi:MAG TPA: hypothetical protein VF103_02360 [Polyangiaceae bacterium]
MSEAYPCNRCGATLFYDPAIQAMRCPYCGSVQASGAAGAPIREIPLEEGFARAARGMGLPVTTTQCTRCGAVTHAASLEATAWCAFCNAPVVLYPTDPNLIRPESLVPFLMNRAAANQLFTTWLHGLWFRPNALKRLASAHMLDGMYVPFWTFDAGVHSTWTARAGHYYYTTEHYTERVEGKTVQRTRQVRHTRWEPAAGARDDRYDDVLLCASRGLSGPLLGKVGPFDTRQLVPYDPSFLAGFRAEGYSIDLWTGWAQAYGIITASQRQRCAKDVPGDTYDDLAVRDDLAAISFKHVLLPIWIGAFWHTGQPYQFMVNGQTGEVVGKAPLSVEKIILFVLALISPVFMLWVWGVILQAQSGH